MSQSPDTLVVEIDRTTELRRGMHIETVHVTANGTEVKRVYPETTRECPVCTNTQLILLRTLHIKFCADCNTEIAWGLEHGQVALA